MRKERLPMKKLLALFLITVLLGGCAVPQPGGDAPGDTHSAQPSPTSDPTENSTASPAAAQPNSDLFTDRDYQASYDESRSVLIQLNGDSISCDSKAVHISGTTAIITDEGTYILSGTLNNGMIVVNAGKKDKIQLVLRGASIHSKTSAPLYILEADKLFLTLAEGTESTLSSGETFEAVDENNIDGAFFSKSDLTLNGAGSLTVTSPAGHGIVAKDDLAITGGTYTINAASHGLDVNDSVRITGAALTIDAGKDGIHAENDDDAELGFVHILDGTLQIDAEGDGISAGAYLQIEGGDFTIVTGGGSVNGAKQTSDNWGGFMGRGPERFPSSAASDDNSTSIKGLKASGDLRISGGTFSIDAADDAVHSNTSITIDGGSFEIATGDDGFHADDTLTVNDGTIRITESYEGLEALHVCVNGGDISLVARDDGLNAAGGNDSSGFEGFRGNDRFGGRGGPGGMGGPGGTGGPSGMGSMGGGSSDGTIVITGGTLYINASGDGLDANGSLSISGGFITVCGPNMGDTATLDYDISGTITGGTFIGTGASGMAQTFSDSTQGVIAINAGNQNAGTVITLTDRNGNTVISPYAPELPFSVVILSSPEIIKGETYTITVGTASGDFTAN